MMNVTATMDETNGSVLNPPQTRIATIDAPERAGNFAGATRNVIDNLVLNPVQERLGLRESLRDRINRETYNLNATRFNEEQERREKLIQAIAARNPQFPMEFLRNLDYARLQNMATNTGMSDPNLPTSVREYEFYRSELGEGDTAVPYEKFKETSSAIPSALQIMSYIETLDPDRFAEMGSEEKEELLFKVIRQDPRTAGEIAKNQQKARDGGIENYTAAERKYDELAAATIQEWDLQGQQVIYRRNIADLSLEINKLQKAAPGSVTGTTIFLQPDIMQPEATKTLRNNIERIVTDSMRATLGAQFTENEARQFIERTFNLQLSEKVLAERMQRFRSQLRSIEQTKSAASKHLKRFGTMRGFTLEMPEIKTFEQNIYKPEDYEGVTDEYLVKRASDYTISDAEHEVLLQVIDDRNITLDSVDL